MADLYRSQHAKPITLYKDSRFDGTEVCCYIDSIGVKRTTVLSSSKILTSFLVAIPFGSFAQQTREQRLLQSTTLYIGNLSFYTSEEQIWELFSKAGEVRKIVMGLDRVRKTPCGFCFVEYYTRGDAKNAVDFLSGTKLDDRIIRVDWDVGFAPGRQFGRGRSGGQVRDEYREDYDPGRGGYGKRESTGMTGMQMWGGDGGGDYGGGRGGRGKRGRGGFGGGRGWRGGFRGRGRGRGGGFGGYGPGRGGYGRRRMDGPLQGDDYGPGLGKRFQREGDMQNGGPTEGPGGEKRLKNPRLERDNDD